MWQEITSPAQSHSVATCIRISWGSPLNPRSLIPIPDVLILNFEHIPSLILRHLGCSPSQTYKCSQAFLQLWTSIHSVLLDQVGTFPKARPGAQAGSLLESESMGDRSYSQWLSEEGPFCSVLTCVSEHLEP